MMLSFFITSNWVLLLFNGFFPSFFFFLFFLFNNLPSPKDSLLYYLFHIWYVNVRPRTTQSNKMKLTTNFVEFYLFCCKFGLILMVIAIYLFFFNEDIYNTCDAYTQNFYYLFWSFDCKNMSVNGWPCSNVFFIIFIYKMYKVQCNVYIQYIMHMTWNLVVIGPGLKIIKWNLNKRCADSQSDCLFFKNFHMKCK